MLRWRAVPLVAVAAALLVFGWALVATASAQGKPDNGDDIEAVDPGPDVPGFARHPLFVNVLARDAKGGSTLTSSTPQGYTPAQMRTALGLTGDGSGQTIAIVDAYDDPNIVSDANKFSSQFGLPPVALTKAMPQGQPSTNAGWALEISLDVEWAHAIAPRANILLVEAASNSFANLMGAIDYAAQHGAVVISNSWGGSEFSGETSYDSHCALLTAVCTFASGDSGNPGIYPAYNPGVVAVGGTTLQLTSSGTVVSEVAWSHSGGGVSAYEAKPAYQTTVNPYVGRGIPDVSYDANPTTGFPVYDSVRYQGQSGWFEVGGTSAGAPQWAALIALADAGRASPLSAATLQTDTDLYTLLGNPVLYDVTSGTNGTCGAVCTAGSGYDFVTGLGSPRPGIVAALSAAP